MLGAGSGSSGSGVLIDMIASLEAAYWVRGSDCGGSNSGDLLLEPAMEVRRRLRAESLPSAKGLGRVELGSEEAALRSRDSCDLESCSIWLTVGRKGGASLPSKLEAFAREGSAACRAQN